MQPIAHAECRFVSRYHYLCLFNLQSLKRDLKYHKLARQQVILLKTYNKVIMYLSRSIILCFFSIELTLANLISANYKTFKEIVLDSPHITMVEFYARKLLYLDWHVLTFFSMVWALQKLCKFLISFQTAAGMYYVLEI